MSLNLMHQRSHGDLSSWRGSHQQVLTTIIDAIKMGALVTEDVKNNIFIITISIKI